MVPYLVALASRNGSGTEWTVKVGRVIRVTGNEQMWVTSKTVLWLAFSVLSKCLRELAGGQNSSFVYQPGFWLEETIFGMKLLKGRNVLEAPLLASSIGGLSYFSDIITRLWVMQKKVPVNVCLREMLRRVL